MKTSKYLINFSFFKNSFKFIQSLFILSSLVSLINAATKDFTENSMKVTPVLGIGSGTLAVIIAIGIGVLVCVFGLAFPIPGLFLFIGIIIPIIVFIFVIFCPRIEEKKIMDYQNTKTNSYVVARWFYFLIMLLLFLGLVAPLFIYSTTIVIPQRVDSRAQVEYDEQYLSLMEKQRNRKYRLMEDDESEPERLPLNSKRKAKQNDLSGNSENYGNLINNESQDQSNNNGNNINNIDNSNNDQLPSSLLPKSTLGNDLQSNRKKFNRFKRKGNK